MRISGKYEKQELVVGLSAERSVSGYREPKEKYSMADVETVRYTKDILEFEFYDTTDEIPGAPQRLHCYQLISIMPEAALPEVEEELVETYRHYLALEAATARQPAK